MVKKMNKIEKLKAELRHYEKKYEELIEGHVQSEINKVDSDISFIQTASFF